jgi:hypothetical protein
MKTSLIGFTALFLALTGWMLGQDNDERVLLVPMSKAPKEAPLFFSTSAEVKARIGLEDVTSEQQLQFKIYQGKTGTLSLALSGPGEVVSVTGEGLLDWSVRVTDEGARFLDLRPVVDEGGGANELQVVLKTRAAITGGRGGLLLAGPGSATGFSLAVELTADAGTELRVVTAEGLMPVDPARGVKFLATGNSTLEFTATPSGSGARGLELFELAVTGGFSHDSSSVTFRLSGLARAMAEGATADLISGGAALARGVTGDGWRVGLKENRDYELVAERAGEFPVEMEFVVPVARKGDWWALDFKLPAGVVVPVSLDGLGEGVTFDRALAVVPQRDGSVWRGFLPADGTAAMAWKTTGAVADGALFFSSTESSDVRIGSGLMRQLTVVDLSVLQGKLATLSMALEGAGEVLAVTGEPVLGWSVTEEDGQRRLDVKLSRPIEGADRIVIESQSALAGFPVKVDALRVIPQGALRHSGWLRVANEGAVRIEVVDAHGLIQLAPGQFPGGVDPSLRQVFVYRFPSTDYHYAVQANQVLPEVAVSEVTVFELAESDRRVFSDLELDIREAPLREWEMAIPADHAVAAVSGAEVADYAVASEINEGMRRLKILFKQPVMDRQLVSVRLEKNEAAKSGAWELPALAFPGAKSRRGYIGAVAAAGYRLIAGTTSGLAEVPVTFFPKKVPSLQQAFRLRDGDWQASLTVEALGQSIQADVFHLYSLKAGAAYGSVLINYFVVGAPATEWKISVPKGIGNIDVTGQNVGRDWRREEDTVIVPLSRPLLGTGTVLLTFEEPMNASGGELMPGEVRPLDVQGERGYIQVVSPLQVKFNATVEGSLLKIDSTELPAEFRLLSSAPTLQAWQYIARDFKIGMQVEWFEPGDDKIVGQVVDFLKLASQVSRDGQWVTDARLFVKTKDRSALRVTLPSGASLWEAKVDSQAVNARADRNEILIPLMAQADPNRAVEVTLRYGARAKMATRPRLAAPVLDAPVVIGEWTITGDEGRQLVPRGGSAELVKPALAESGWEWLARHPLQVASLLLLGLLALLLRVGQAGKVRSLLAVIFGFVFVVATLMLALSALSIRGSARVLEYAAPVVTAGHEVAVQLGNVAPWQARVGWGTWLVFVLGVGVVVRGVWMSDRCWRVGGFALLGAAFLSIRGGAALFFCIVALVALTSLMSALWQGIGRWKKPRVAQAVAMLIFLTVFGLQQGQAAESPQLKLAESMIQDWQIREGRLHGSLDLTLRADVGDRFLLLRPPAVLTAFEGQGLRVTKAPLDGVDVYVIVAEEAGRLSGRALFEMAVANPVQGWTLPSGPAAMRQITLRWDQPGWEFSSPGAARVTRLEGPAGSVSGGVIVLGPSDPVVIQVRPQQRDIAAEERRFFAEVSNLYLPGPGVVNGRHRVSIRPAQGRISSLLLQVPEGFTVSDVNDGPVGSWRYDPTKRELRIPVEPAQDQAFSFTVETQRGATSLPMDLDLQPLRVDGAAGEIGFLALAFGEDAQPESVTHVGLSRVNPGDFDADLLPRDKDGNPLAVLQHAFRYGTGEVSAQVKVTAVAPELRADSWQLVSLGEDRLLVATDLTVSITRSGVFRLAVEIPSDLEVETATGEGLSHWTVSDADGKRVITLHLAGRTLGQRTFSLTLTGRPPAAQDRWQVSRLSLLEASRETGIVTVVPERGLQVRAVDRKNVSQIDPRSLAEASNASARAAVQPGALVYRLLQGDWALGLAISRLDPWVTAQVFHEATLREGQMLSRVVMNYKIENAAVKALRIRIPGLDPTAKLTVSAKGPAVADLVAVEGEDDLWELHFQRGVAGETQVELKYQRAGKDAGSEVIEPVVLDGVRQVNYFTAIFAGGRLELEPGTLPRGWQRADWAVVQSALGQAAGTVAPLMVFRVADPDGPLPVVLKRHELAGLQKLRVAEGTLTTLMSPAGESLTAVDLKMEVVGKSTLQLKLPASASLYNVLVNDEGVTLVRKGGEWLFYVFPSAEEGRPASVRFVYASGTLGGQRLEGPILNVPMENLTWRVLVPEGWMVTDHGGDFDLKKQSALGGFRLEDYQSFVQSKKDRDSKSASALLDQANSYLAAGDQEKASNAFSNAVRSNQLDAPSGEDARVQLRELKTQQALLGLNTRRQKLVLDNRTATPAADQTQLDRAAEANPVLRGAYNFDPKQFDRFLEGNTADENAALKEIANRMVAQQLAAEPAPVALDVTLPERGTVLTFGRSVQVDGQRPMAITVDLKREGSGFSWLAVPLCLLVGAMGGIRRWGNAES